mgnify:FL=1
MEISNRNFRNFVEKVCQMLEDISCTNPRKISACKNGEDFEACVVEAVHATLEKYGITAKVYYTPGGHAFPDIVIEFPSGERYGIEVKSSSSSTSKSWKINGNSVLGSTKENVIDTYIIFGKTALGNQGFRFKRYEEAVANVAVTHSPRYAIDMDIAPDETFFVKSGLSYRQISESNDPIGLITAYFKSQGQRAWWLSESTPAAIRMFSDLPIEERNMLIGYCFAHFPEVFSNSQNKFSRCAMWLATEHSIVSSSLRDNFSAGGRFEYCQFGRIPRIFDTLQNCREFVFKALNEANIEELLEDWGIDFDPNSTTLSKVNMWIIVAATQCPLISETGYDSRSLLYQIMGQK